MLDKINDGPATHTSEVKICEPGMERALSLKFTVLG